MTTAAERLERVRRGSGRKRDLDAARTALGLGPEVGQPTLAVAAAVHHVASTEGVSTPRVADTMALCDRFADRNLQLEAERFEARWTTGEGAPVPDLFDALRQQLDRSSAGAAEASRPTPLRMAAGSGNALVDQVCSVLQGAVDGLTTTTRNGRPWPGPKPDKIKAALDEWSPDPTVALRVAREARRIVQEEDKAYNVSGLFAERLETDGETRATVRGEIKASLEAAAA